MGRGSVWDHRRVQSVGLRIPPQPPASCDVDLAQYVTSEVMTFQHGGVGQLQRKVSIGRRSSGTLGLGWSSHVCMRTMTTKQ